MRLIIDEDGVRTDASGRLFTITWQGADGRSWELVEDRRLRRTVIRGPGVEAVSGDAGESRTQHHWHCAFDRITLDLVSETRCRRRLPIVIRRDDGRYVAIARTAPRWAGRGKRLRPREGVVLRPTPSGMEGVVMGIVLHRLADRFGSAAG